MPTDQQTDTKAASSETIASGISGVVNAALSVGAALARTVAVATAADSNAARNGTAGESPLAEIVHYSVEAAANFARLVVQGVKSTAQPGQRPSQKSAASTHPTVHAGSTLRIPLSIENPSDVEMPQMRFYCGALNYQGNSAGSPLTSEAFVFQPNPLTIAPRDFEKITIFITTGEEAATGIYLARIMVEGGSFESPLSFEVLAAAQAET